MKKTSDILLGSLIIIIGVIWFGNSFEIWNIDIFFKGWWTLFIIIPAIVNLFKGVILSSLIYLTVGILLLLGANDIIDWSIIGKSIFPLMVIFVGITIMFKPKFKVPNKKGNANLIGIFSGNEVKITDKFDNSNVMAIFGGVSLDLRKAVINEDKYIDVVAAFGGVDLLLPDDVNLKLSGVPVFGGTENKYEGKGKHTIYINYVCAFGGLEIK